MFTGIVTAQGTVRGVALEDDRMRITVESPYQDLAIGDSVAIDGACLTVVDLQEGVFSVDAVITTRGRTRFDSLRAGDVVNLERALKVGDRLGGHFVQGHVDGVGRVVGKTAHNDAVLFDIEAPPEIAELTVLHGSIAVNGVSMTVNAIPGPGITQISVIPYTMGETNLGLLEVGDAVHLESDMLGKYVRQLLDARSG